MQGLVLKSMGSSYRVRIDTGEILDCVIRGKFRIKGLKLTNPVAVGDMVEVEVLSVGSSVITEIHKRKNYIIRKSVNLSKQYHILASNVDLAVLIATIDKPVTSFEFIDRFLLTAEAYQIPVLILVNKIDLYGKKEIERLAELISIYEEVGYDVKLVSVLKRKNLKAIKELFKNKITAVFGHSGVGKSSLLNEMVVGYEQITAEISEMHQQGVHTTTFAEMLPLEGGGYVVDTPGIKGLGVVDVEKMELGNYFPEFVAVKDKCHFNDCVHINEPKCAVKEAVENEEISPWRYRSYLSMYDDGAENLYR
ncbi:MAG: ribosome biogenesis GTPase [Saprospiraceae bacterium]|jgi:ribosome biogenesis GTPase